MATFQEKQQLISHPEKVQSLYPGHTFEKLVSNNRLHSYKHLRTPRSGKVVAYWLIGILIIAIGSLFLPWQQNIRANGFVTALLPEERPQRVNAIIDGYIEHWYVQEGQYVRKGDPIVRIGEIKDKYFDPKTLERLVEQVEAKRQAAYFIKEKIHAIDQTIVALKEGLKWSLDKAKNKLEQAQYKVRIDSAEVVAAQTDYDVAKERFARYQALYEKGLLSLTDFESRKLKLQEALAKVTAAQNKLLASRNELMNARIEISSIEADYQAKIAKAIAEKDEATYNYNDALGSIAKLENEKSNIEIRNQFYIIRAPQSGLIVKAAKTGIGETIKQGEPVATIMPEKHTLAVELYVSANDVPLISRGRKVRLQFDGWPALQFSGWPRVAIGTFGGVVKVIDFVNSKDGKYRVLVTEDPEDEKWPHQLRIGSGVLGWAMLDEVTLGFELWRQFNGFPPSLSSPPEDDFEIKAAEKEKK
ncbi:MAG: HlyD family efflux transporter periplasmic adaptor subunit [Bacteroidia bacterium]|nr:HlyD family secretion protein [Bacteroidia bacterium]MDW8158232.1 HlyD family efflux transporter periplasmic adaptor subunit [Bacteroidia bacterium]